MCIEDKSRKSRKDEKTPKEEFKAIINAINSKGIIPTKIRISYGRGSYEDLFWGRFSCSNKTGPTDADGYWDKVLILPYQINKDDVNEAIKNMKGKIKQRADIDPKSGNIHPNKDQIKKEYKNIEIKQIVLAATRENGTIGPAIPQEKGKEEPSLPNVEQPVSSCKWLKRTPRANYYPMIENDEENLTDSEKVKQEYLKEIFGLLKSNENEK